MRLFAGIFPPPHLVDRLAEEAAHVKQLHPNAILVKPEKMHLTVRFFGKAELDETIAVLKSAVDGFKKFEVLLDHVDAFPNRKMARVVFCGVCDTDALESLMRLAGQKRPHGHLTLARLATPRTVKKAAIEPIAFTSQKLSLVNSVLGNEAHYETLEEWNLD